MSEEEHAGRLERLKTVIAEQKRFLHRIPDPENRERAELNLMTLVEMREQLTPSTDHVVVW